MEIRALSGMRVYDATMGVAGPYCTSLLAQSGAEVVKIEPPGGDWGRNIGQSFGGLSTYFLTYNRGKNSVVLDLKSQKDREHAKAIIATCDLVVESFRPGVMAKLGLDYETVAALRPDIIYASISGFGQHGPTAQNAALDTIMQASTGWMHLNRDTQNQPIQMDHIAVDVLTGLHAYQACVTAIIRKLRFKTGSYLDISLLNSTMAFLAPRITEHILSEGNLQESVTPPTGIWATKDEPIAIAIKGQTQFETFCNVLECPEMTNMDEFASRDLRMSNKAKLTEYIQPILLRKASKEWTMKLLDANLPVSNIRNFGDLVDDPQVEAMDLIKMVGQPGLTKVPFIQTPGFPTGQKLGPAPTLGSSSWKQFAEPNEASWALV